MSGDYPLGATPTRRATRSRVGPPTVRPQQARPTRAIAVRPDLEVPMFGLFKQDPARKLKKAYEAKLVEARDVQRSGDVVAAAKLYAEAEKMREELDKLEAG